MRKSDTANGTENDQNNQDRRIYILKEALASCGSGSSGRSSDFLLHALAVAAFSLPFLVLMRNIQPPVAIAELLGVVLWGVAIAGEARADWQLAHFRADPNNQGRVCREGLWAYSRHPNYVFEWLHWYSYVVMTLGTSGWVWT